MRTPPHLKRTKLGFEEYTPRAKKSIYDQMVMTNAILLLDVDLFRKHAESFGVPLAGQGDDSVLKILHIARINSNRATDAMKQESENWLRFRNISWNIKGT